MEYRKKASRKHHKEEHEEQEESDCASVLVSGLSGKTTKDSLQMYFENSRRSNGGEVKSVTFDGDQALVTFESPDVAKKVLEWGKHTLNECILTVSRPIQHKDTPLNEEEDPEQPLPRSRMVRVLGISDNTTKDALLNFFENTRRSGGGDIEDIQHIPDEGLADITFCSPEVSDLVSQKEDLELDGSKLTVTLKEIPKEIPKDPNKLHVIGISVKTTKDGLMSFMEVVSGKDVESMLFGSNYNAMITFKEPPDLDKAQKKCSTRALDESHLKIEQVNICDCIELSGLAPNTTKDTVLFYFDNPKNGGGDVKSVEMDLEKARAILFFEEPEVLNNVTKRRHTINGAKLEVVPYYPFLGETSTSLDEKKEKVVKVRAQSMVFINKFFCQEFYELLQETRIMYMWQQATGEIVLGGYESKMDKTSWQNSCQAVVSYVNQIVTENITVSQEAYKIMFNKSKERCASFKDQVDVICMENERLFTLTGKKTDVDVLTEQLNDLKSDIEKEIIFKKNKISKSISIPEAQIELLSISGFVDDLQAEFEDLEVTVSKKDLTINLRGPDAVVKEGNITVWQTLSKVKEAEMELPKSIVGIVTSQPGRVFISAKFKKENMDAVLTFDPNSDTQIMVTALDRTDVKKAKDIIKDITSEQSINVDANQKQLLHTKKWEKIKHSIHQSMLLQVTEELASSTLWIAGIKDEVDKATEKVGAFFEENITLDKETKNAERVSQKKSLVLDGSTLSVTLKEIPKDIPKDPYKLHVMGISEKTTKDGLMSFLEVVSGEEVESMLFGSNSNAMVTFKEPPVAKKVLSKSKHELKGTCLTVVDEMESRSKASWKPYKPEGNESECASVLISGLSGNTTKDAIQMYFENSRRSSGGEVKSVELDGDQAFVTFESPDVAKKVLEWGKHTLDGCPLTVSRPIQHKDTPSFTEEDESEQPVPRSRVVRVCGLSDKTTKEALLNFFENTRRSGGGDVDDIQHIPDEGLADITFYSPEDAERVSQKKRLVLDGSTLSVTLKEEIPKDIPKDPYKLHVMGISEKTTKDGLMSFLEVVSGKEVGSMLFGSNSNVMVTFKEPPDLDKAQKKCSTRALDGSHLKIEQVNICDCIEVSELAPNTTKDTVFFYFDNPRNGGGEVKSVEMDLEKARAILFFEDPEVLNNVMIKRHTINGAKLKVVPYYPFLGETSTTPDQKKEKGVKVNPQSMVFINKFFGQEFDRLLQESRVKHTWQPGSGEILLNCVEPKMEKTSWENSIKAVASYVNHIVTEKITVSQEAWDQMYRKAKERCASFKEQVDIKCKEKERLFTLTGKETNVSVLAEQLNDLNSEIEKKISFEKNKISKSIPLTEAQIDLLYFIGFVDDLQARCKDLEVTMSKNDLTINFRGTDAVVREGNITVWQTLAKVKETELELSKSIVGIVGSEAGRAFMATKFKKDNIDAVVSSDPVCETQVMVTAIDRRDTKKAVDLIKDVTSEESILLDANQKQLLHNEKWKELKHSFQKSMLLQVKEEPASSTLWIAGIKEEVDRTKEKIESFFEVNVILNTVVETENGRVKFIFKYKHEAIKNIEQSLRNQYVQVKFKNEGKVLEVTGTRDGIDLGVQKVKKLINDIKDGKVDLNMPGMRKLFSGRKGINLLSIVENEHLCIIERCSPSLGKEPSLMNTVNGEKSFSKLICSYVTPENNKIILYKGDITEHKVDVIVNAANSRLQHIGGVAKSILNKGGRAIQVECDDYILRNSELLDGEVFMSGAGKLPCKRLVHAVGPKWNPGAQRKKLKGDETREELILSQTIHNSLKEAKDFTSIAFPAISSGVFGFPVDVCAHVLIDSALEYSEENSNSKLYEIHFVDMDDGVIKAFYDEMRTRFDKESSFTDGATPKKEVRGDGVGKWKEKGKGRPRKPAKEKTMPPATPVIPVTSVDLGEAGSYDDPNSFTTAQGMKIVVIVGDLAKEEAHAIVNTVSSCLNLSKNPCASSLSNAAGPGLQQECKKKGSLSAGKMLVTDGYNLGCKNVFHVVAGEWRNNQGEHVLRSLIQSCLKESDKRGFSSIAFPAIGTGNLGFPRDVVARAFFEEADTFKAENPQSPLNEVHLVLFHKDISTVQAFQDELKKHKPKKPKGKRRSYNYKDEDNENFEEPISKRPIDRFFNVSDEDAPTSASYLGPIRLEIISGDITKATTDAIATVSNTGLIVSQGGVGTAIAKAGGPSIQKECDKLGKQKPGSVVWTTAGFLATNKLFHLVSSSLKPADISEVVLKCFTKAESMGITSIAVPAMGTGIGATDPKNAAKALLSTIEKFSQEQPTSLNYIRIVVFQEHMLQAFYDAIQDLSKLQSGSGIWGKLFKGIKDFLMDIIIGSSSSNYKSLGHSSESFHAPKENPTFTYSSENEMWLEVFAGDNTHLKKAETAIKELLRDHASTKFLENHAIEKLSDAQRERILRMETEHDTKIQIDKKMNRIVVRGASEDVSDVTLAIYQILNENVEEEHGRRFAELLSKNVKWYYMDGSDEEPYDEETNAKIEQAYNDKKNDVLVMLNDGNDDDQPTRYKIIFSAMEERNLSTGDTTRVERKEATSGISLPAHWDPQPKDGSEKELDVHLVVLDPTKHKKEYDEVKTAIEKTSPINIVKIERVQNPTLYKTYAVKKQKMDEGKGSNEKKLFHGTAPATCDLINYKGFNRSYCGKNAIVYGMGVYFARDASYSMRATYSPPEPGTGRRCMYMASVLAGEFTQGKQDMVAPPAKDPKTPTITYDTVVDNVSNPQIYVVFHDTQNYPDYLITFQ